MIKRLMRFTRWGLVLLACAVLSGCDDPQVYGSVGVSSGWGSYHGGGSTRMHTSISVGGRIR